MAALQVPAAPSVDVTPLFPVPGNAISNEPGVPLSRKRSGKGPGSLQLTRAADDRLEFRNIGDADGVPNANVHSFLNALFGAAKTASRFASAMAFSPVRLMYCT